jgi:uncharacterized repeat protein (TIGR01451 family)
LSYSDYGEFTVKKVFTGASSKALRAIAFSFALLTLAFVLSPSAQAAISGGTTIYNTVKVTYLLGSTPLFSTASVSLTVNTISALPAVTNPLGQTTVAGALVVYNYRLKSNSNGTDTYTTIASSQTNIPAGINAVTGPSVTASVSLWGGIVTGSGSGTITVPHGTTSGLTAGVSTVQIENSTYTVAAITPGAAAYTNSSGNLVAEVPATLTLTLISGTAITAGSVTAGTQAGEYKTTALTMSFTTGTLTTAGTDGTYASHFTITTGALPAALSFTTKDVITTVSYISSVATIAKYVRNVSAPIGSGVFYTYNASNYYLTGVTAKPGDILEYILVATNSGSGAVSSCVITDVLPANYVSLRTGVYPGTKDITYVNEAGTPSYLAATYAAPTLTVYVGTGATSSAGGTISSGKSVLILYQSTVNN